MILAREITKWEVDFKQPNHTYLASDDLSKIFGYFKWHNPKDFTMFSKPMRFDKRYRKFKIIQKDIKDIK